VHVRHALSAAAALAACALAILPAATATAASGPAADPAGARAASAAGTAPSAAGNPRSARAQAAAVCADAYQIGSTAYIDKNGAHIASVKQFYSPSCKANYGYLWIWQSYRATVPSDDLSVGVYDADTQSIVGQHDWIDTKEQEFWSFPAQTVQDCTAGIAWLEQSNGVPLKAQTDQRC
jgi:hypothetical protein